MDALFKSSTGKSIRASLQARTLLPRERSRHALKALGICWGLSLLTAPLPPIHWVTVPFFFFYGIYLAFRRWKEETYVQAFSFACPECGKTVEVREHSLKKQWEIVCPHCRFALKAEIL